MKAGEPKSLVLITVDCLRRDHTGFMEYSRPTTPFLDHLARESFVFPNAIVTGTPTYYSLPGLLTSRFPLSLGRGVVGIPPGEPTLATVLQGAGYRTAAFIAANPYVSPRFGYEQGFEVFRDFLFETMGLEPRQKNPDHGERRDHGGFTGRANREIAKLMHKFTPLGKVYDEAYFQYRLRIAGAKNEDWETLRRFPGANVLVDNACDWLKMARLQPFFLWLHFMDPHAPYYPSAKALDAMGARNFSPERARYLNECWKRGDIGPRRLRKYRDEIVTLYDAGIRWVDTQLSRLAGFLRSGSLWESCVFVVTADHGEEFLDRGGVFHSPSRPYQEMLRVPLLIRVPGIQKKLSAAPFSLLHVAPTVLDAIGIESPEEFEGRSYWPEMQAGEGWHVAISEAVGKCTNPMDVKKRIAGRVLALQEERYKLIIDFERGVEELYDLQYDPDERNCFAKDAGKTARARLLSAAREHLRCGKSSKTRALRATVREIGLECSHFHQHIETQPI